MYRCYDGKMRALSSFIKISSLWLILAVTFVESQTTACSANNRSTNIAACLTDIKKIAQSKDEFWFGTRYATICPTGPGSSLKCVNYDPNVEDSLVSRTFGDYSFKPSLIDRYIDVKYTTRTGQYSGCGNRWIHATSKSFNVDPISRDFYHPFDTILQPDITWQYSESDYYFLLFIDVGNRRAHGTFVNIRKNDIANAEIIKRYVGPMNPREIINPYVFLLFKQSGILNLPQEWKTALASDLIRYNMTDLVSELGLTGPIAMNWVRVLLDPYSVQHFLDSLILNNCAYFVTQEITKQNRSFIPTDVDLNVFVNVQFRPSEITYKSCCTEHKTKAKQLDLNPLGNEVVNGADVRTGVTPYIQLVKKAYLSEATTFAGTFHTLLAVDPDVPSPTAGTLDNPLLHWQIVNIPNGTVSQGMELKYYRGPQPPDKKPHQYYFLLYEQTSLINTTKIDRFAGPNCSTSLQGRCRFDVRTFVNETGMTLVGASWFFTTTDEYVRYIYTEVHERDKNTFCTGVPGYVNPCPVSATSSVKPALSFVQAVFGFFTIMAISWLSV